MKAPNRLLVLVVLFLAGVTACGGDAGTVDSPPPSTANALTTFSFKKAQNASLPNDIAATINGDAIAVTVPTGTSVTALVATFDTTGASVTVGSTPQTSGSTPNDFSSPVNYRVTAASGATRDYTVTVTVAASTAKSITAFSFTMATNPGLTADVTASINGTTIAATVPFGTSVGALVATFTSTGANVTIGTTPQVSGATSNNFTTPVTYLVHAGDGSVQSYTVTVTVALSSAKSITAFAFRSALNPSLPADVTATINGNNIDAALPFGANASALIATFTSTGQTVSVLGMLQTSGTTANNFTSPVVYHVSAADGTTRDYTVTVTVAQNPAKDITAFLFRSADNPGLSANATGVFNGTAISVVVPFGTSVASLIATFSTTGQMVSVGGTAQNSGITANNFASPVVYRVTAANGTTKDYTVTVTVASGTAKDITSYVFRSADNPSLTADVTGTIAGTAISVVLPFGTTIGSMIATFQTSGVQVTVGGIDQVSGVSSNNFSAPVVYHVRAVDNSTQDYTVTVTTAPNPAKDITAFAFLMANNAGLTQDVSGSIMGTSITVVLPFGSSPSSLVASFTTTGASVAVGGVMQVSGTTSNNFSSPVVYRVTAADMSTKDYTVTVGIGGNPAKDILSFTFLAANNPGLPSDVTATINGTAITATIPFGPDVTRLVASFATTGTSVTVGGTTQVSGMTQNSFTSPVVYRVTAADMSTKDYTVTLAVTCEPLSPPTSGTVAVTNGGISPSTATYSCNPGLVVDASATRTCDAAGIWSGTAPTCQTGVMVVRVGDGTAAPTSASTRVFIEEHAITNGFLTRTIPLPTTTVGNQFAFTLSGTANTEGMLARSVDGSIVSLAGYATGPGVASISTTPNLTTNAASINRVVAFVTRAGTVDTSTLLANAFNTSSPRGAVGLSGGAFWVTGANGTSGGPGGVHYMPVSSNGTTIRVMNPATTTTSFGIIAGGQLYASTTTAVVAVGTGTPTSTGVPFTNLAMEANIRSFAVFDRNPVVAGPDTIYMANSTAVTGGQNTINVEKFTFDGTQWSQATMAPYLFGINAGALGLAAWVEGNNIRLLTTQNVGNNSANRLLTFVDDGSALPVMTVVSQAPVNAVYRGCALSPNAP